MTPRVVLREVRALIEAEGCAIEQVERGSKHAKLRLKTPNGPRLFVFSMNGGDWRILRNLRTDLRRLIRTDPKSRQP